MCLEYLNPNMDCILGTTLQRHRRKSKHSPERLRGLDAHSESAQLAICGDDVQKAEFVTALDKNDNLRMYVRNVVRVWQARRLYLERVNRTGIDTVWQCGASTSEQNVPSLERLRELAVLFDGMETALIEFED